ncbi:MAG: molybdopterin biosynthesis protein [Gemmataceae bacterium]
MSAFQQQQFLEVIDRDEAERRFRVHLDLSALEPESVPLGEALGRILAGDVVAPVDVPFFDRSNVDGFAVQASDTFGASEEQARELSIHDEIIATGVVPRTELVAGMAASIATGGMIPRGADSVVMVEHTEVRGGRLRVTRPVVPGANLTHAGTDIGRGEVVLRRGQRMTARETGVIAALGLDRIDVIRMPRVAILSTGDELLAPGQPIRPGMVHDSNSTVLADTVRELGGVPRFMGIVGDDDEALDAVLRSCLDFDMVLLTGGTSKGAGDLSYRAVARMGSPGIVAHGVALKPGKPLCLAVVNRVGGRPLPVAVLPGFPTSAIFTFHEFLAPILRAMAGVREEVRATVTARLPMRVTSEKGRTEYLLVGLVETVLAGGPTHTAYPMGKGSGSVTAFARADGFLIIPRQREYLEANEVVEVHLLAREVKPADLVVIGSHCTGLDFLLGRLQEKGFSSKVLAVGSTGGLEAARRGECDIAGIHLLDPATDRYNTPFLDPGIDLVPGYLRRQGLVFRPDDPRFGSRNSGEVLTSILADRRCMMISRNRGSGTRLILDRLLGTARPPGYLAEARSHSAVCSAIAQQRADWGVAIEPAARALGLGFLHLRDECYDFLVPSSRVSRPAVRAFLELLEDPGIRAELDQQGFRSVGGAIQP